LIDRLDRSYKFVHDRVQEAAYALIPENSRAEAHLKIGRLLAAHTPPEKRDEAIFEIVNQLNRGAALISSHDERERLAELNLLAGRRAKASSAYASALTYLTVGATLLPEDVWDRLHDLAFEMELHSADCEIYAGALQAAEQRLAMLATHALSTVQLCAVARRRADLYTMLLAGEPAVTVALASVVNAVQCAVELQNAMAERNADIPQEKRIEFRIGINVGDIIVDRGDIWGDGVNVAARLEALAEPGGICVSGRVQEDVQGKLLSLVFEDAGEQRLKNIARPVRVYRVRLDEVWRRPEKPSIETEGSGHSRADGLIAPEVGHPAAGRRRWLSRHMFAVIPLIVLGATSGAWWWLASRHSMPTADATYVTAASNTILTPSATDSVGQ
jgi:hypothetical protein